MESARRDPEAAGPLQVASGLKGGAEAAIHGMKLKFECEATDAILLVDAANAFNQLNRLVALHNIQYDKYYPYELSFIDSVIPLHY